jgi:hypothetical protein
MHQCGQWQWLISTILSLSRTSNHLMKDFGSRVMFGGWEELKMMPMKRDFGVLPPATRAGLRSKQVFSHPTKQVHHFNLTESPSAVCRPPSTVHSLSSAICRIITPQGSRIKENNFNMSQNGSCLTLLPIVYLSALLMAPRLRKCLHPSRGGGMHIHLR